MADYAHLKRCAISGVTWIGLSTVITSLMQLLQVTVLARFLHPADFGLVAMAMVVVGVAQAFNDMGISNAVIQRQDTDRDTLSSLFWLQNVAGVGLFLMIILVTPLTVRFYNEAALTGVMLWTSLVFLVTPPGQLFQSLLQKELRFKAMATVETGASVASLAVAILSAWAGLDVLALVLGQVAFYGIRSVLYIALGCSLWKPRLHFRASDLQGYISFGLYQIGERIITYLSINVISLIIDRYLGADALGRYSVAYQMTVYPILRINTVIMQVSFPILSKLQDVDGMLARVYMHMTRATAFVVIPALTFAIVAGPALVPMLLGPGWSGTVLIFQILCVVALFKALGSTTVPAYLAKGRADLGFAWNFVIAAANGVVFYLAAEHGIIALLLSFAALSLVQFVVMQIITGRIIDLKLDTYLGTLARDAVKCLAAGGVAGIACTMGVTSWTEPVALCSRYLLGMWLLVSPA